MELKILEKRIENKTIELSSVALKRSDRLSIVEGGDRGKKKEIELNEEDFSKKVKADFQSLMDLIQRRRMIKSRIVLSNATTKVTIGGEEMTVADAIERKISLEKDSKVLLTITNQRRIGEFVVSKDNELMEANILKTINEKAEKMDTNKTKEFIELFRTTLISPIKEEEKRLEENLQEFSKEVDITLVESNNSTFIEID